MPTRPAERLRIAYLVSQYPSLNHAPLMREVRRLRAVGLGIRVISIRGPDRPFYRLTPEERNEATATYYVRAAGPLFALRSHFTAIVHRPAGYFAGLRAALSGDRLGFVRAQRSLLYFAEALVVGDYLRRQGLTHLHTHYAPRVALLTRTVFPVSMSATVHGPAEFCDPHRYGLAETITASAFICAVSNYGRERLIELAAESDYQKIEVAPFGIDLATFAPGPARATPSPLEVLCVARLASVKGQRFLIAALDRLVSQGCPVRLRLVGDGPERHNLERNVAARGLQGNVVFEGWCNQDRVSALYRTADIFALPSLDEGVPAVLLEAMAMAIPCIATAVGGVPELIRDGVDGLLVGPADDAQLTDGLARLLGESGLRQRLGAAGRRRVAETRALAMTTNLLASIFRRRLQPVRAT